MQVKSIEGEHSAILSTFIKLPFVIKIFVCLLLSGRFRQVLLYMYLFIFMFTVSYYIIYYWQFLLLLSVYKSNQIIVILYLQIKFVARR